MSASGHSRALALPHAAQRVSPRPFAGVGSSQRGVATLVVVMLLLFLITMAAAYASRNVLFEQRTGANFLRATQAFEAAEAGLQWSLAQLNGGRIDDACLPSTDPRDPSFQQRYIDTDPSSGVLTARRVTSPAGVTTPLSAVCVSGPDAGNWRCACPRDGVPVLDAPVGPGAAPAFSVTLEPDLDTGSLSTSRPGSLVLSVIACTRLDPACLTPGTAGLLKEGRAFVRAAVYQSARSMAIPRAALTVRGSVNATGLTVSNARFGDSGITVHASGDVHHIGTGLRLDTLAGNALSGEGTTLTRDPALDRPALGGRVGFSASDRFFAAVFNLSPMTALEQPALVGLGDCGGGCTGQHVLNAADAHPGRPVHVQGGLRIATAITLGSATDPMVLVVDGGDLDIAAAGTVIHGLVFVRPATGRPWTIPRQGLVRGAVVVDGDISGSAGGFAIDYDGALLRTLRSQGGSFVVVPGSWRDMPRM
jgi:hypothetical protein